MIQASARAGVLRTDPMALRRALHFSDLTARDLIVPRQDIVALRDDLPVERVLEIARRHGYTRYPVYRETIDDVAGVLNVKDLVQVGEDGKAHFARNWRRLVLPMPVVPEQATIEQVLERISRERQPMLLLVDEYGGTSGILTTTDIADELIGGGGDVRPLRPGVWLVKGETAISTVESTLDISLDTGDHAVESVGGLIMAELGRIPQVGEQVTVDGNELRVVAMQGMRVRQALLRLPPEEPGEG